MTRKVFSAIVLIFLTQLSLAQTTNHAKDQWVDSVFQVLTLEQRIGQLFMVAVYSNGNEEQFQAIENKIRKNSIGGLVFMDHNPVKQVELTNRFQQISNVPLLIGVDKKHFPNELAMGAIEDDTLIYKIGKETARQLKLLGVHISFEPSAMLGSESYYAHTFGDNANKVGKKSLMMMNGLQDNGILACGKFFPGLYDDGITNNHTDSRKNKKDIAQSELKPFQVLIDNNISAVIIGHAITSLDFRKLPSSLSSTTIKVLKEQLGFKGLVIADAFNEKNIKDKYKPGKAEALAFSADNDLLLSSPSVNVSIRNIKKILKREKSSLAQLDLSIKKILAIKFKVGLSQPQNLKVDNLHLKLNTPETNILNQEIYRKSVTVVKNMPDLIPIKELDEKTFASLSMGDGSEFTNYLDKYATFSHYKLSSDIKMLEGNLSLYDYVVVGVFDDNWNSSTAAFIDKLSLKTKVILCSFINPYKLKEFYGTNAIIAAYSNDREYQQMVPQVIFGGLPALGKLPISISASLPNGLGITTQSLERLSFGVPEEVGMDSRILNKINGIAIEAIKDKATPGCQVLVARNGKIILNKSYGYFTYDSINPVDDHTIYDIASITKVAATTQAIMFLEERGVIDLDKKVSHYLPELKGTNKENMILRDILTHQAGLWPYLPFWQQMLADTLHSSEYYSKYQDLNFSSQISDGLFGSSLMRDSLWQWVKHSKLRNKEYRKPYDYKYSDMGYYLLLKLIEKSVNQPIEEFLQQNFYDPLGLNTLCYLPLCRNSVNTIAPTEYDNYFRKILVNGLVHDQGAAMLGGVAGHAGLFSNALDLAKLMQMNLQDGKYGGNTYFMNGTVERFTSQQYESNRRGLGWDKPVLGEWNSPTSAYASRKSFGHSGFTGTAVWVDPEFQLVYVFLSNRIYPDAENKKLIENNIRTRIQDLIYQSIWSYSATLCVDDINKKEK
jgi:beta-N-acetylhexosaminidase